MTISTKYAVTPVFILLIVIAAYWPYAANNGLLSATETIFGWLMFLGLFAGLVVGGSNLQAAGYTLLSPAGIKILFLSYVMSTVAIFLGERPSFGEYVVLLLLIGFPISGSLVGLYRSYWPGVLGPP